MTVWEVGRANTAKAALNAEALIACQRYAVGLWEAATGQTYPRATLAPWLN